jgi:predicted RNA-binding protein YlqC (UPF0109 family)
VTDEGIEGVDVDNDGDGLEDLDDLDDDRGNRVVGATSMAVLDYLARSIVDEPDAVVIDVEEGRNSVTLRLHVAPDDMGKVIGRRGRVAQAIRTVVRAASTRDDVVVNVDIVD